MSSERGDHDAASATEAHLKAAQYMREALRQKASQPGYPEPGTLYQHFVCRAIAALEARAGTELRIADMYEGNSDFP